MPDSSADDKFTVSGKLEGWPGKNLNGVSPASVTNFEILPFDSVC